MSKFKKGDRVIFDNMKTVVAGVDKRVILIEKSDGWLANDDDGERFNITIDSSKKYWSVADSMLKFDPDFAPAEEANRYITTFDPFNTPNEQPMKYSLGEKVMYRNEKSVIFGVNEIYKQYIVEYTAGWPKNTFVIDSDWKFDNKEFVDGKHYHFAQDNDLSPIKDTPPQTKFKVGDDVIFDGFITKIAAITSKADGRYIIEKYDGWTGAVEVYNNIIDGKLLPDNRYWYAFENDLKAVAPPLPIPPTSNLQSFTEGMFAGQSNGAGAVSDNVSTWYPPIYGLGEAHLKIRGTGKSWYDQQMEQARKDFYSETHKPAQLKGSSLSPLKALKLKMAESSDRFDWNIYDRKRNKYDQEPLIVTTRSKKVKTLKIVQ
jgi:hypothetical protein